MDEVDKGVQTKIIDSMICLAGMNLRTDTVNYLTFPGPIEFLARLLLIRRPSSS